MTQATLDLALFRAMFAEFADATVTPDAALQMRYDEAANYITPEDEPCGLPLAKVSYALMLCLAHLCRLARMVADTASPVGVVTQAQVDKVSVTLAPPPMRGEWGHWLAQTPYGVQLSAFLNVNAAGGFYVGGLPERAAFRKVGGIFL